MTEAIKLDAGLRGITRLCHFTPSTNLINVLESGFLKDRATLEREAIQVVNPTDNLRLDNQRDKICCTVEYPNTYYLTAASNKELVFNDWVILLLKPIFLWQNGTMFCERNAAAQNGALIKVGEPGYRALFGASIGGRQRQATHLLSCPTDLQAEVLVAGPIALTDVIGMVMKSDEQVRTERVRWDTLGIRQPMIPIFVGPDLFNKNALRNNIWAGRRPNERRYE